MCRTLRYERNSPIGVHMYAVGQGDRERSLRFVRSAHFFLPPGLSDGSEKSFKQM